MKKMKTNAWRIMLILALLFSTGNILLAQQTVSGTVADAETGEAIPGVSVYVKGTTTGTITDIDGNYSIAADNGTVVVFSFIGYISQEVEVSGATLSVSLQADMVSLDEVVAVGYGVQKKKELTGAVAQIKSEEMAKVVASDFTKTLQGQVAGVNVTESSGRPGDQANIQIRGLGSITSDTQPLYVVDGIPYNSNPNIASEDIATVDILKDGAAAAVYGTRASNGVILITTKRGKAGQTKVSFSSYYGIQNITSGTPLLTTKEHLYVDEQVQLAAGGDGSPILSFNPNALDYDTDFVESIQNDNAAIQNYNLTLSGGKDDLTFNLNTNYFSQDGILRQSGYDRFTTRANATLKKGKFSAFASVGIMHANKEVEPWGLYEFAMFQGPYRPPLGDLPTNGNSVQVPGNNPDHVGYLSKLLTQEDDRVENSYNVSANLKYEIIEGLSYQLNLGMNYWNYKRNFWQPQLLVYDQDGNLNELGSRQEAILRNDFNNSLKYTMENVVNYTKTFNKHTVSALLGYTIETTDSEAVSTEKRDFIDNSIKVYDGGKTMTAMTGRNTDHRIVGKLARVQYNFDDRYLFSASIRRDASSNFSSSHRYANFPGASVGWNISEESFMENVTSIDNLKLRASYGEVGNQGIPSYLYQTTIDPNIDYIWGSEDDDELGAGAIQRGYANPDVKWETNVSRNIGIDLLMFGGKFSFTADVYQNDKKDMLLAVLLPPSAGTNVAHDYSGRYKSKMSNVGNMVNKGLELAATYKHRTASGFNWSVTGTFTKNVNEVTDLGLMDEIALQDSKPGNWRAVQQDVTTYMRPGYEAGAFFLIPTDGIIKTQEQLDEYRNLVPTAQLGDVRMVDAHKDGVIDDNDRVYQGSGMPDFEAGMILTAEYKGFDASLQLYYSHGNEVYNGAKLFAYSMNRHKDLYYMWTPANSNSDIPSGRVGSEHDNWRTRTDYFLEDGTFLRVRNFTLGYTVPKRVLKGKMDNIRFYVTAQNPLTFTGYEGYDPEVGGNGISTRGIDKGTYPVTRKFLMGIQVDF